MKRNNVIKNGLMVAMTASLLISLAACGGKGEKTESASSADVIETANKTDKQAEVSASEADTKEESDDGHDWPYVEMVYGRGCVIETYKKCEDLTDWGNYEDFLYGDTWIYIKYPTLLPPGKKTVAYQNDDSLVMTTALPRKFFDSEFTDLESILPVAIECSDVRFSPVWIMNDYWNLYLDETCTITIDETSLETVGQYECCKYTGTAKYTGYIDDKDYELPFVAYATFLKNDNEPFCWIVFDESEDHSFGDTIAEHARKMGLTLTEAPRD